MEIEPGERIQKTEEREEKSWMEVRNSQEFGLGDTGVQRRSKKRKGENLEVVDECETRPFRGSATVGRYVPSPIQSRATEGRWAASVQGFFSFLTTGPNL